MEMPSLANSETAIQAVQAAIVPMPSSNVVSSRTPASTQGQRARRRVAVGPKGWLAGSFKEVSPVQAPAPAMVV